MLSARALEISYSFTEYPRMEVIAHAKVETQKSGLQSGSGAD
jgi:hypothetical protein